MPQEQPNNPLHGITLQVIVTELVEHYGWEQLGRRININSFHNNPSIKSSLKFLRKTDWGGQADRSNDFRLLFLPQTPQIFLTLRMPVSRLTPYASTGSPLASLSSHGSKSSNISPGLRSNTRPTNKSVRLPTCCGCFFIKSPKLKFLL